jgi:hypothetical protein
MSANKMEEDTRGWENCIMRTFTILIPKQSKVITRTGVRESCNKQKRDSTHTDSFGHLEVNWKITLRQILKKYSVKLWLEFIRIKRKSSGVFILKR